MRLINQRVGRDDLVETGGLDVVPAGVCLEVHTSFREEDDFVLHVLVNGVAEIEERCLGCEGPEELVDRMKTVDGGFEDFFEDTETPVGKPVFRRDQIHRVGFARLKRVLTPNPSVEPPQNMDQSVPDLTDMHPIRLITRHLPRGFEHLPRTLHIDLSGDREFLGETIDLIQVLEEVLVRDGAIDFEEVR